MTHKKDARTTTSPLALLHLPCGDVEISRTSSHSRWGVARM